MRRFVPLSVLLCLLVWSGPADAERSRLTKEDRVASFLGHEPEPAAPASDCAEDAEGDVISLSEEMDTVDVPEGDLVRWCAAYAEGLTLRMAMAAPTDPGDDPRWLGVTVAVWFIDVTGDEEAEFQVEYGYAMGGLAAQVYGPGGGFEPRCEVPARYRRGELVTGEISRTCLGGRTELNIAAGFLFDTDPESEERVVTLDESSEQLRIAGEPTPPGSANREMRRIAGPDRFATAVALSQEAYPDGALKVYLIRADHFADMPASAALTGEGPLLPVPSCGPLPAVILEELRRLAPMEVIAVGGADAICEDVVLQAGAA